MKKLIYPEEDIPSIGNPYINEKVSRAALVRFLNHAKERNVDVHALEIWHDNELMVSLSMPPYDCTDKRLYYSLSKSFVSTAIGIACDEGLISTQDKIIDIFPDKVPENIGENLKKCRLCHILSMNTGVAKPTRSIIFTSDDLPKAFLAADFVYEPGTHYVYDSGATAMLAAVILRVTGMSTMDYLNLKLFRYLDIRDVYWDHTADGQIQGGTGLHASCKDAAKLGLLYLNRGMWNGRRILSEKWVDEASAIHSDNGPGSNADSSCGYCYQFWCNARGGYRGDGAYGQYCYILPEQNMVAAMLSEDQHTENAKDILHDLALELFDTSDTKWSVEELANTFYSVPGTNVPVFDVPRIFKADENEYGISYITVDSVKRNFVFTVSDGLSLTNIRCGNGEWIRNRASVEKLLFPKNTSAEMQTSERTQGIAASYINYGNMICAELRCLYSPHHVKLIFTFEGDKLTLRLKTVAVDRIPFKTLTAHEVLL